MFEQNNPIDVSSEIHMIIELYHRDQIKCVQAVERIGVSHFIHQATRDFTYNALIPIIGAHKNYYKGH